MSHIFISYYQGDADFAAVLSIHLEKAGFDTWMDKSRLRPGQDWSVEIDEAITNSHALIVIMSPEAKASEYVTYEWSFALGAGVQVIPVLYKETSLHPRLARIQHLKFTDTTVRPWDVLIETVTEVVQSSDLYHVKVPRNAPPHVKSAIAALDSANEADRQGAVSVLAQTDHPTAGAALLDALGHPLTSVRWDVAQHITDDVRAIPVLVEAFLNADDRGEPGYEAYTYYAKHLAKLGSAGMDALLELLTTSDRYRGAAEGLRLYKKEEPVGPLLQILKETDPSHRLRAAHALKYFPSETVEQELISSMVDSDDDVRLEIVKALIGLSYRTSTKVYEALLDALIDHSERVRQAASSGFYNSIPENVKERLLKLLRSETAYIALAAHRAMMKACARRWEEMAKLGLIRRHDKGDDIPLGAIIGEEVYISEYGRGFRYLVLMEKDEEVFKICYIKEDRTNVFIRPSDVEPWTDIDGIIVTTLDIEIASV